MMRHMQSQTGDNIFITNKSMRVKTTELFIPLAFYSIFNLSDIVRIRAGTHLLGNILFNVEIRKHMHA